MAWGGFVFHRFQTFFSVQRNLKAGVNNELWSFFRCAMLQPIIFPYLSKRTQKIRRQFVQGCTSINVFTARKLKSSTSAMHLFVPYLYSSGHHARLSSWRFGPLDLIFIAYRWSFHWCWARSTWPIFLKRKSNKNKKIFQFDSDLA